MAFALATGQQFVAGHGATEVRTGDQGIVADKLPILNPKEKAMWRVVVKTMAPGDMRFTTELICDELEKPLTEMEATQQY
jgi:hypothetical protein